MKFVIGIDEVGRGPLAGPVVVCALALAGNLRVPTGGAFPPLRDSKKLSELQREFWYAWIKKHPRIRCAVSRVNPRGIDRLNISRAANLAATRAFLRLVGKMGTATSKKELKIKLDGGLYLYDHVAFRFPLVATIIKADEKYTCVKLASIVAKVTRDRFMNKLHKKYPEYSFAAHKGYGTRAHILAIKKYGVSDVHRRSFVKNFLFS